METIPKTDCKKIGFIRKTHGVHGEVILEFDEIFELSVEQASRFFIELEGLLVPFFVSEMGTRIKSAKSAILSFKWVDSEDYARRMAGASVWLLLDEIIDEKPGFSLFDLQNFVLFDQIRGNIGLITSVNDFSGNIVLTVVYKNSEILIPYNDDFLVSFDLEKQVLILSLPDGLIED
jgi:16S rRNA processing protein RimM